MLPSSIDVPATVDGEGADAGGQERGAPGGNKRQPLYFQAAMRPAPPLVGESPGDEGRVACADTGADMDLTLREEVWRNAKVRVGESPTGSWAKGWRACNLVPTWPLRFPPASSLCAGPSSIRSS